MCEWHVAEERRQRERLEKSYGQILEEEAREQQRKTIQQAEQLGTKKGRPEADIDLGDVAVNGSLGRIEG